MKKFSWILIAIAVVLLSACQGEEDDALKPVIIDDKSQEAVKDFSLHCDDEDSNSAAHLVLKQSAEDVRHSMVILAANKGDEFYSMGASQKVRFDDGTESFRYFTGIGVAMQSDISHPRFCMHDTEAKRSLWMPSTKTGSMIPYRTNEPLSDVTGDPNRYQLVHAVEIAIGQSGGKSAIVLHERLKSSQSYHTAVRFECDALTADHKFRQFVNNSKKCSL